MVTQVFKLNLIPDSAPIVIHCDQYDKGTGRLVAYLYNGDVAYTPASGATAAVQGTKPDNHGFDYSASISGNAVTMNLTEQMTACSGRVRCQLVITEGDNRTGTFVFELQVQDSALPEDSEMSASDYALVEQLIETAEALNTNVPYIGANGNWWIWSVQEGAYVDSGVDASITVTIQDVTMLDPSASPYVTNSGTNTDPVFHLFIPRGKGISSIAKISTSGLVDTYRITYSDGAVYDYTVTNGAKGDTGNGIQSIAKTGTAGIVDTYTVTYTNGTTFTYTVTNGMDSKTTIAPLEATNVASRKYEVGEQFYLSSGVLYTATQTIAQGATITIGTNCEQSDTLTGQLYKFVKKVSNNEVYGLRQGKGNMVDLDLVGGSVAWNQLVQNGNFADIRNWSVSSGGVTFTVSNHVATFKAAARYDNLSNIIAQAEKAGHKLLYSFKSKSYTNSNTGFILRKFTSISPAAYTDTAITLNTSNTNYSGVVSIASDIVRLMVLFQDNNSSGWGNIEISNVMFIDLTQLFGSTIADYIYSLEQATAGAGVEWFRQYFPKDYYAYNAGALQSVNVASRKVVGKNLFNVNECTLDQQSSKIAITNDTIVFNDNYFVAARNNIRIPANKQVVISYSVRISSGKSYIGCQIDNSSIAEQNKSASGNYTLTFTTPKTGIYQFAFCGAQNPSSGVFSNIQIEIGTNPTAYEPYKESIYPFDSTKQLRGIPKLANGKLYYDGDLYSAGGKVTRKYGIQTFTNNTGITFIEVNNGYGKFYTDLAGAAKMTSDGQGNVICNSFPSLRNSNTTWVNPSQSCIVTDLSSTQNRIGIVIYGVSSESDLNTYLASKPLTVVYELATPTTETAEPFQNPQRAYSDGTEEMVDAGSRDVAVPVGNNSVYYLNDTLPFIDDYVDGSVISKAEITALSSDNESGKANASRAYSVGEHFYADGQFKEVTAPIAINEPFSAQNSENKPIADCLQAIDVTSEFTFANDITFVTTYGWTKIYKVGNLIKGYLRFATPDTVIADKVVITIPTKYLPRTSGMFFSALIETWTGAICGMLGNGSNSVTLISDTWQPSKIVVANFEYVI